MPEVEAPPDLSGSQTHWGSTRGQQRSGPGSPATSGCRPMALVPPGLLSHRAEDPQKQSLAGGSVNSKLLLYEVRNVT